MSGYSRREFLRVAGKGGVGLYVLSHAGGLFDASSVAAVTQGPGLSDPAQQPKFAVDVPNALDPGFVYDTRKGKIKVAVGRTVQQTGLVRPDGVTPAPTTVWGYGDSDFFSWPGRTFEVRSFEPLAPPSRRRTTWATRSTGRTRRST